ncbi:MAG: hypothetical protein LUG93_10280 [Lachnospiraceae bacterium]|nr:hypothetical protein [Lachnospiraceae bacterium]
MEEYPKRKIPAYMTPQLNKEIAGYMQTMDYADVKDHIYVYSFECEGANEDQKVLLHDLQLSCPSLSLYGFRWFFIVDLSAIYPVRCWEYLDYNTISRWVQNGEEDLGNRIKESAIANINRKLSSVRLELLYDDGCIDPQDIVAVYAVSIKNITAAPKYGCSLMLSERFLKLCHEYMGAYYLFPFTDHTLYLIRECGVAGSSKTAQEYFSAVAARHCLREQGVLSERMLYFDGKLLR